MSNLNHCLHQKTGGPYMHVALNKKTSILEILIKTYIQGGKNLK